MIPSTRDALWQGRLVLWQPARGHGYRFNLDPVLLANFAAPAAHVVDLGAGCGVLGLMLLALGKAERVTAVELQPHLAELARRNARENGFEGRYEVLCGDLRSLDIPQADQVVFNPPYFPLSASRASPVVGRDWARREHHGTLRNFAELSLKLLKIDAAPRASAIVPSERGAELEAHWAAQGAKVSRRRIVHARVNTPAQHALLEASLLLRQAQDGRQGSVNEPPLVLHQGQDRAFTDEVSSWVAGPATLWNQQSSQALSAAG